MGHRCAVDQVGGSYLDPRFALDLDLDRGRRPERLATHRPAEGL